MQRPRSLQNLQGEFESQHEIQFGIIKLSNYQIRLLLELAR